MPFHTSQSHGHVSSQSGPLVMIGTVCVFIVKCSLRRQPAPTVRPDSAREAPRACGELHAPAGDKFELVGTRAGQHGAANTPVQPAAGDHGETGADDLPAGIRQRSTVQRFAIGQGVRALAFARFSRCAAPLATKGLARGTADVIRKRHGVQCGRITLFASCSQYSAPFSTHSRACVCPRIARG